MKHGMAKVKHLVLGALLASIGLWALAVTLPHTFSPGDEIKSAEMNANFQALVDAVNELEAKLDAVSSGLMALPSKSGQLGYAWVVEDGSVGAPYFFMSNGATPTANRVAAGVYDVTFPGFDLYGGHVQVTTYIRLNAHQDNICSVDRWTGEVVRVVCVDQDGGTGTPQDTSFTVLVLK